MMDVSFEIQCPPFELKLSHWDTIFPYWGKIFPPSHAVRIHCMELSKDTDTGDLIQHLHIAFHQTVHRLPFLAGTLISPPTSTPLSQSESSRPWLYQLVPRGVACLDVKHLADAASFETLVQNGFAQDMLTENNCPLPNISSIDNGPAQVCRFQANLIRGGMLLVVAINHIVADGRGVTDIIGIFANYFRQVKLQDIKFPLLKATKLYRSDRTQIIKGPTNPTNPTDIQLQTLAPVHPAWTSTTDETPCENKDSKASCRVYRMSAAALLELKAAASSSGTTSWISTNDAISAFIWQSVLVARHHAGLIGADRDVYVAQPVDCRAKLKLEHPYFGNSVYMTQSSLAFSTLADEENGLRAATQAIHSKVQSVAVDQFRDIVGQAERADETTQTRMMISGQVLTGGIIITSHFKFGLYEMDWGPLVQGRQVKALRFPTRGTMAGTVIVFPKLPDGSCEYMITEQECTIQCLEIGNTFRQFATIKNERGQCPAAVWGGTNHANNLLPPSPVYSNHGDTVASDGDAKIENETQNVDTAAAGTAGTAGTAPSTLTVTTLPAIHMGKIRIIQLNRPEAKNAITMQMLLELQQEVEQIHLEFGRKSRLHTTRVIILASALDDVFCAGADLKQRMSMNEEQVTEFLRLFRSVLARLAALPVPTIAAVAGLALGGGLELTLCCHFRVFASSAIVGLPETRLGIIPGAGGTYRLPTIVGLSNARDLILTGRHIQAPEAHTMGLCNRIVQVSFSEGHMIANRRTLQAAIELAKEISVGAPLAIQAAMRSLSGASPVIEEDSYASLLHTEDRLEGLASFIEKRVAHYTGL